MRPLHAGVVGLALLGGGVSLPACTCRAPERATPLTRGTTRRFSARTDLDRYELELTPDDHATLRIVDESGPKQLRDIELTGVFDRPRGVLRLWSPLQGRTKLWSARPTGARTMTVEIDPGEPLPFQELGPRDP